MFPLITSLFCQNAVQAIPTLALISSSHLASSNIQLPKYLNRVTCSNCTPFNVTHVCDLFVSLSPPITSLVFVFLTLISMPYSLQVSFSLSIIFCMFFLVCHQHRIISVPQICNVNSTKTYTLHILHSFSYHELSVQIEQQR